MGTIKKSTLAYINGKIGNLVIRNFNGKKDGLFKTRIL